MTREDFPPLETRLVRVGNYKMTGKVLGKGSFATVEEAVHVHLKVKVSVKTIELAKVNSYVLKHLKREAAILTRLEHPHVMRLFETMKSSQRYWLVCELMRGGDLCAFLRQQPGRRLGQAPARRISRQIAAALHYLHGLGIVHRDLKLENIMLDSSKENIKLVGLRFPHLPFHFSNDVLYIIDQDKFLTDFGLSAEWAAHNPLRTLCGSPDYCAPELFVLGRMYGPEVDLWALGVVLYAMAAGRLPFPGVSARLKTPQTRCDFLMTMKKGLTQSQLDALRDYTPEFGDLVKGLMNPCWQERLTVEEVLKNPWLSNKNHWTSPTAHSSLDAYDRAKIVRKLGVQLDMTQDKLKLELKNRPCGEVAGFYNIMAHQQRNPKCLKITNSSIKLTTMSYSQSVKVVHREECNETDSKVCVFGAAQKINQVTRRLTRPSKQTVNTTNSPTLQQHSQKSHVSSKVSWRDVRLPGVNRSLPSSPEESVQDNNKDSNLLKNSKKCIESNNKVSNSLKLKRKNLPWCQDQPILPSKFKLKFPVNNNNFECKAAVC